MACLRLPPCGLVPVSVAATASRCWRFVILLRRTLRTPGRHRWLYGAGVAAARASPGPGWIHTQRQQLFFNPPYRYFKRQYLPAHLGHVQVSPNPSKCLPGSVRFLIWHLSASWWGYRNSLGVHLGVRFAKVKRPPAATSRVSRPGGCGPGTTGRKLPRAPAFSFCGGMGFGWYATAARECQGHHHLNGIGATPHRADRRGSTAISTRSQRSMVLGRIHSAAQQNCRHRGQPPRHMAERCESCAARRIRVEQNSAPDGKAHPC